MVTRGCRVIPVILEDWPGVPPVFPAFLEGLHWVDFRTRDPEPFEQLVWGISGER